MSSFSKRFKHLREAKGWTQDEIAEKLGVSRSAIAGYESESKSRTPRKETLRNIADMFGVTIDYLLGGNMELGQKSHAGNDGSPIELSEKRDNMGSHSEIGIYAPVVAEIACGQPMYAEDSILDWFPVNPLFANVNDGPYVWVKAKGDSMINVRIFDGSLVLLRIQSHVDSGDIAAVCIDSETATLKRVYFLSDGVMLSPENPNMSPTTYDQERVRIVGKAMTAVSDLV